MFYSWLLACNDATFLYSEFEKMKKFCRKGLPVFYEKPTVKMFDIFSCPKKRRAATVTGTRPWPALWPFSSGSASPLYALPSSGEATKEIIHRQCCGSVTFWYGSGSADPYHWLPDLDPGPAFFVSGGQDAKKMFIVQICTFKSAFITKSKKSKRS